jgi:hypothetical protein
MKTDSGTTVTTETGFADGLLVSVDEPASVSHRSIGLPTRHLGQ